MVPPTRPSVPDAPALPASCPVLPPAAGAPFTEALTVWVTRLTDWAATEMFLPALARRLSRLSALSLNTPTATAAPRPTLVPALAASAVRKRIMRFWAVRATSPAASTPWPAASPSSERTYTPETLVADTGVTEVPPAEPAAANTRSLPI